MLIISPNSPSSQVLMFPVDNVAPKSSTLCNVWDFLAANVRNPKLPYVKKGNLLKEYWCGFSVVVVIVFFHRLLESIE